MRTLADMPVNGVVLTLSGDCRGSQVSSRKNRFRVGNNGKHHSRHADPGPIVNRYHVDRPDHHRHQRGHGAHQNSCSQPGYGTRQDTNFSIESVTANGTAIRLVLKNTGSTSATDFAHMDFIADYVGGGPTISKSLTYTEGLLGADQWRKTFISPDNLEKDVWNETETLTLDARLTTSTDVSTTATVAVGTPDGQSLSSRLIL